MEKASRAIRRSGVKLLSMSGGYTDLNVLLSDVGEVRSTAKAFMNAQQLAAQDMMRWAANEENRAVHDVVAQIYELQQVWMEIQKIFTDRLKDYRQMYEMILDGQKNLAQARANWDYCDQKETKLKKELKKAVKRVSSIEINILENRISQAEQEKELAQIELLKHVKENEAVKLIRLKEGFVKMSNAYIEMSHKCNTVFTAQRDVSLCLPDVHNIELESSKYTAAATTRQLVQQAKEQVANFNEANCPNMASEPPPPYTPPDPASNINSGSRERPPRPANPSFTRRSSTPTSSLVGNSEAGHVTPVGRRRDDGVCATSGESEQGDMKYTNVVQIKREGEFEPEFKQALTVNVKGGEKCSGEVTYDVEESKKDMQYAEKGYTAAESSLETGKLPLQSGGHTEGGRGTGREGDVYSSASDHSNSPVDEELINERDTDNQLYPTLDKMDLDDDKYLPQPVPRPRKSRVPCDDQYDTAEEDDNDSGKGGTNFI